MQKENIQCYYKGLFMYYPLETYFSNIHQSRTYMGRIFDAYPHVWYRVLGLKHIQGKGWNLCDCSTCARAY